MDITKKELFLFVLPAFALIVWWSFSSNTPASAIDRSLRQYNITASASDMGLVKVSKDEYILTNPPLDPATGTPLRSWTIHTVQMQTVGFTSAVSNDLAALEESIKVPISIDAQEYEQLEKLAKENNVTVEQYLRDNIKILLREQSVPPFVS